MGIYTGDLQKGDIIIMSGGESASSDLFTHAAIITQMQGTFRPFIMDITGYAFERRLYTPNICCDYVYRLRGSSGEEIAAKAAATGNAWVTSYQDSEYNSLTHLSNLGIYSHSSILTSYLGRSFYGPKAMAHAEYLYKNCRTCPPRALHRSAGLFSGAICSYLPIALYQTVLGRDCSVEIMELDARKSLPRDLARYLDKNLLWICLGTATERRT